MRDFQTPGRSAVFANNGMAATSHPLAAKSAIDMLQAGGNAVDAALTAATVLCICEPHMTGLGGDMFALVRPAGEDRIVALNGSGRAPAKADAGALRAAGHGSIPVHGPEAVTMPGAVDAMCRLSQDWGRLGLAETLAPAIRYAEQGVPIAPRVARDWAEAGHLAGAAREFFLVQGKAPRAGQNFRAPGLAEVLRRIAEQGRAGFYEGEVAEDLITSLTALGGWHGMDDLAAVASEYTDPISSGYKGYELVEHAPNGQGAIANLILNILSQFDLASMDPLGVERVHIEAEATKLAYDARNRFLGDADHMTRLDHLLSPETGKRLAGLIDPARAMVQPQDISAEVHRDTVYLTVVDSDGMAVSLIWSIFHSFGSGLASEKFGLIYQNRGAGFTLDQGHPNELAPGKRPLHTIIPAMLRKDGRLLMPFGVMGGQYQACGHARFVTNLMDYGMDMQSAIDAPRAFPEAGVLRLEATYPHETVQGLTDLGHKIAPSEGPIGGAQAIWLHNNGVLEGASDPRKDGIALGY